MSIIVQSCDFASHFYDYKLSMLLTVVLTDVHVIIINVRPFLSVQNRFSVVYINSCTPAVAHVNGEV